MKAKVAKKEPSLVTSVADNLDATEHLYTSGDTTNVNWTYTANTTYSNAAELASNTI